MADDGEPLEPGRAAFNRGEYFLAHELWEEVWREVGDAERRLYVQGLIQIAAGLHHLQERRSGPAAGLLRKGLEKVWQRRKGSSGDPRLDLMAGQVERLLVDLDAPKAGVTTEVTAAADLSQVRF
jgi:predicted metal-dependent hydrolase